MVERFKRKYTPVVSKPELVTTKLVEPEIAGSVNPVVASSVDSDNTAAAPAVNVGEPNMNDYQWNQRFYDEYMTRPMTKEEEDRRKQAATAVTGIGHLGNAISSLANVAFAGEAPSQVMPKVADPKLQSFSDRLNAERQKYGAGRMAAVQGDLNNYYRALQMYRQDQARKEDLAYRKAALDRQTERDRVADERWNTQYEDNKAYRDWQKGIEEKKVDLQRQALNSRGGRSGSTDDTVLYGVNNERFVIPKEKRKGFVMKVYQAMKDTIKMKNDAIKNDKNLSEKEKAERMAPELDDLKLVLGEGGDQISKAEAIVGRRMAEFPELTPLYRELLGASNQDDYHNLDLYGDNKKGNDAFKYEE